MKLPKRINWREIPVEKVAEGIERQVIVGEKLMRCRLRFAPRIITPEQSHPHEQITLVESGRVLFLLDGEEVVASAGEALYFPPNSRHGATMLDEEVILIDIFAPSAPRPFAG